MGDTIGTRAGGATAADILRAALRPGSTAPIPPRLQDAHPQLEVMHQGTGWHRAGLVCTAEQHAAAEAAEQAVFPQGLTLTDVRVHATDDPADVMVEYRRQGPLWDGRGYADGGLACYEFEAGRVRRVRNFLNVAYTEAVTRGWEELLSADVLLNLPAWRSQPLAPIDWRPCPASRRARRREEPAPAWAPPYTHAQRTYLHFGPRPHKADIPFPVAADGYTDFQGTCWFLAGRSPATALTRSPDNPFTQALAAMFTPPGGGEPTLEFTHFRSWDSPDDPQLAFMEWVSLATLYTGRRFRNHGLTALTFDDAGRRVAHREYCNTAYLEAVTNEADFPKLIGAAFPRIPAARTWSQPAEAWTPLPIDA